MAIPTYDKIMPPLLALAAQHDELSMQDAIPRMADHFNLTAEERAKLLPDGARTYIYDRAYWARTYLLKAGLIEGVRRGVIRITLAGRELLARDPNFSLRPARTPLMEAAESFCATGGPEAQAAALSEAAARQTPQELIAAAEVAIAEDLRAQILEQLQKVSPDFFERLIVDLMLAMGYGFDEQSGRKLGRTGDGGIDGEIYEDKLGLDRILLQAKRYAPDSAIGAPQLREFIGSLDVQGVSKGVFVTTSYFTESARNTPRYGGKRIVLIDGARLAELMVEHQVGVRVERSVSIKALDLNYFEDV